MTTQRLIELHDIWAAASLLTRLPVPVEHERAGLRAAQAVWAWPVVGAALGAAAGSVAWILLNLGAPTLLCAVAALALTALATGALHEDGIADCADGLGGGHTKDRALAIMKDSRIGAFGAVALVLVLLGRAGAISELPAPEFVVSLAAVGALSRAVMAAAMRLPTAREGGLSAGVGQPSWMSLGLGASLALAFSMLAVGHALPILLLSTAVPVVLFLGYAKHRLGGQTGDVLGATQQLAELGTLCGLAIALSA